MSLKHGIAYRLILLTLVFVIAQFIFAAISIHVSGMMGITRQILTPNIWSSSYIIKAIAQWALGQIVIYGLFIYVLWYFIRNIHNLFKLNQFNLVLLIFFMWLNNVILLLSLHTLYATHSVFTLMIQDNLLAGSLTDAQLKQILFATITINLWAIFCSFIALCWDSFKRRHFYFHAMFWLLAVSIALMQMSDVRYYNPRAAFNASTTKPNIILIGFDALRPDFLSYFNQRVKATPNFDKFLQSSTVFTDAYTPLSRTFPSWAGVLTAKYPYHNGARENNIFLDNALLDQTLPKRLQNLGYTTIYATDDKRFNMVDKRFGFDQVIGPDGTIADFLISTFNDFPLSNLISTTVIGRWLFPYNYANRAAFYSYAPNTFLNAINRAVQDTNETPLFLAVHFDLSGWPFMWFNDSLPYNTTIAEFRI